MKSRTLYVPRWLKHLIPCLHLLTGWIMLWTSPLVMLFDHEWYRCKQPNWQRIGDLFYLDSLTNGEENSASHVTKIVDQHFSYVTYIQTYPDHVTGKALENVATSFDDTSVDGIQVCGNTALCNNYCANQTSFTNPSDAIDARASTARHMYSATRAESVIWGSIIFLKLWILGGMKEIICFEFSE